jgi:hypothetical protein
VKNAPFEAFVIVASYLALATLVCFLAAGCVSPGECVKLCGPRGVVYFEPSGNVCVCATQSACPEARP